MKLLQRTLLLAILLAAFALYTHNLDAHSLWRDEALTIARAQQPVELIMRGRNIVQGVDTPDLHPPLHFLLLHGWRQLAGDSPFAYRYFSVLTLLLAMALIGRVAQRVGGQHSGLIALLLLLVSPFYWWYAQETRMYSLVMLLAALFVGMWWRVLTQPSSWRLYAGFTGATLLLVGTHYLSIFLVAAAFATLLLAGRLSWRLLLGAAAMGLLATSILRESIAAVVSNLFQFFAATPFYVLLTQPLTTFWLGSAEPPTQPQWWYVPFVLLLLAGILIEHKHQRVAWSLFAVVGIFGTVAVAYVVGLIRPNYSNPRHLTILLPIVYITMARGATALSSRDSQSRLIGARLRIAATVVAVGGALVLSAASLRQTMLSPPVVRDDVAGIAAYLAPRVRPGDLILWHDYDVSVTYDFYALDDVPYVTLPRAFQSQESAENELKTLLEDNQRVWFVTARTQATLVSSWLRDNWTLAGSQAFEGSWIFPNVTLFHAPSASIVEPSIEHTVEREVEGSILETVEHEGNWQVGAGIWTSFAWSGLANGRDVCLRLQDSAEKIHTQTCRQLRPEMAARQMLWLPLPRGLPPIAYELSVTFGDVTQSLTMVELIPATAADTSVATFDHLTVDSIEWLDDEFTANSWAIGDFVWQVDEPLTEPLRWESRLVDWRRQQLGEVEPVDVVSADYPPTAWRSDDVLRARVNIPLPFEAGGRYRLQLRTVVADVASDWQTVGRTQVQPWPQLTELPEGIVALPDVIRLNDAIKLESYKLVRARDKLLITLYWLVDEPISADFNTFIHVAQTDQAPRYDGGGIPVGNARPTSTWRRGEIIIDQYEIVVPAEFRDTSYNVAIGMFDPLNTDYRTPITVNGEAVRNNILILEPLP